MDRAIYSMAGVVALACLSFPNDSAGEEKQAESIQIAAGGKSRYVIVIPDEADQARLGIAANLLQKTVSDASGATLPIVLESKKPAGVPAFYLGKSQASRRAGLPVDGVREWAYLYQVREGDIYIVGDDAEDKVKNKKRPIEHLGTLKGVVAFLEDQLGVRFLMPGEHGVRVPKQAPLTVEAAASRAWKPRFEYVIGRAPRDRTFAVSLSLFGSTPVLKTYGGHSYYTAVPTKVYGKTNPEFFALRGGLRTPHGNHLCISNPRVRELMIEEMTRQLDNGYQMVELAQTDGYQPCQCERCLAIHPDTAERLWIVHRDLAAEMAKLRPGKRVMLISYGPTVPPPKTFTGFPDNVVIQMCAYTPEMFERWRPHNVAKTVYIYNWGWYKTPGYFGPCRTPNYVVTQVRHFLENQVVGIYICGGYKKVSYGMEGPALYAFGKALEDPDREPGELLDDYVQGLFGEAAVPMRAFYRSLYRRLETFSAFDRPNTEMGSTPSSLRAPVDYYCHCLPARLVNEMTVNLDRAKRLATDPKVKAVLLMVELDFSIVRSLAAVFQIYRAYRIRPTQGLFDELAGAVARHSAMLDALYDEKGKFINTYPRGLPLLFPSLSKSDVWKGGKSSGNVSLKPPFNWDFTSLKANGILPGTGETQRVEVTRAKGIELQPDLNKQPWPSVPFHELNEISMGKAKNPSRFKMLYDEEAVYFGVECDYSSDRWLDFFKPMGRDGNAWAQECMELAIDPAGERNKHCQFVFNPVPDSTYDARLGYIDDPLHPLYGRRDASWNGEWAYAAHLDKDAKRWTAVVRIPFTTLGTSPAVPGTRWTLNVGRAEWPEGRGKGKPDPIYSTWSPNLESRSFHDRATFGEAVFK